MKYLLYIVMFFSVESCVYNNKENTHAINFQVVKESTEINKNEQLSNLEDSCGLLFDQPYKIDSTFYFQFNKIPKLCIVVENDTVSLYGSRNKYITINSDTIIKDKKIREDVFFINKDGRMFFLEELKKSMFNVCELAYKEREVHIVNDSPIVVNESDIVVGLLREDLLIYDWEKRYYYTKNILDLSDSIFLDLSSLPDSENRVSECQLGYGETSKLFIQFEEFQYSRRYLIYNSNTQTKIEVTSVFKKVNNLLWYVGSSSDNRVIAFVTRPTLDFNSYSGYEYDQETNELKETLAFIGNYRGYQIREGKVICSLYGTNEKLFKVYPGSIFMQCLNDVYCGNILNERQLLKLSMKQIKLLYNMMFVKYGFEIETDCGLDFFSQFAFYYDTKRQSSNNIEEINKMMSFKDVRNVKVLIKKLKGSTIP